LIESISSGQYSKGRRSGSQSNSSTPARYGTRVSSGASSVKDYRLVETVSRLVSLPWFYNRKLRQHWLRWKSMIWRLIQWHFISRGILFMCRKMACSDYDTWMFKYWDFNCP